MSTAPVLTVKTVREQLYKMRDQFEAALPKHFPVDRMLRLSMTCIQRNPDLMECAPITLYGSLMTAAQLGLEPNTPLHECVLVPFWNNQANPRRREAQLLIEYKGLLKLVRRSGEIGGVMTGAVYEKDLWQYERGLSPVLKHIPSASADKGKLIAVYAIARFKDGSEPSFDWMWTYEVEKVRARSRAATNGPWISDYEAMCTKTVLRRLCKTLPTSIEVQRAVDADEKAELGLPQEFDIIGETVDDDDHQAAEPKKSGLDKVVDLRRAPQMERPAEPAPQPAPAVEPEPELDPETEPEPASAFIDAPWKCSDTNKASLISAILACRDAGLSSTQVASMLESFGSKRPEEIADDRVKAAVRQLSARADKERKARA